MAGGKSRRMGVDKTLLPVDGQRLAQRVVENVSAVCRHAVLVTNRPDALESIPLPEGVSILKDEVADEGPLRGLATALEHAQDDWVLAVAADMPWLVPQVIRLLWENHGDADVIMPMSETGPEPLLALYHRNCLPAVRQILDSGQRRPVLLLPLVRSKVVSLDVLRSADPELVSLLNMNTPADLARTQETLPRLPKTRQDPIVVVAGPAYYRGLASERHVEVCLNGIVIDSVSCTDSDLEGLAVGRLSARGLLGEGCRVIGVETDASGSSVDVRTEALESVADGDEHTPMTWSCPSAPKKRSAIGGGIRPSALLGAMHALLSRAVDSEGCALSKDGELALVREDVFEHNALDKLLGRASLDGLPVDSLALVTTGRITSESVLKAASSDIAVIASRHGVSDTALQVAEELGVTVVGHCRGNRLVIYTHPGRIAEQG